MRLMYDVMRQSQMEPFLAKELNPVFGSDAALDEHIRGTAITLHHPLGTCKMGRDDDEHGLRAPGRARG
jgi:choline dehydrogenase/4-pyridoxate dehydrogenase